MTTRKGRKITAAWIGASVTGLWRKAEWTGKISGLAAGERFLNRTGSDLLSIGEMSEKVMNLPKERRLLQEDGLAKSGLQYISGIRERSAEVVETMQSFLGNFETLSKRNLRTVKGGDLNAAMAAQQIRARVSSSENPSGTAHGLIRDLEAAQAVLSVSREATGLTEETYKGLLAQAEHFHIPDVAEGRKATQEAIAEVERATGVAIEMVGEASGLIQQSDGSWKAAYQEFE